MRQNLKLIPHATFGITASLLCNANAQIPEIFDGYMGEATITTEGKSRPARVFAADGKMKLETPGKTGTDAFFINNSTSPVLYMEYGVSDISDSLLLRKAPQETEKEIGPFHRPTSAVQGGTKTIAGLQCTLFNWQKNSQSHSQCETSEGYILQAQGPHTTFIATRMIANKLTEEMYAPPPELSITDSQAYRTWENEQETTPPNPNTLASNKNNTELQENNNETSASNTCDAISLASRSWSPFEPVQIDGLKLGTENIAFGYLSLGEDVNLVFLSKDSDDVYAIPTWPNKTPFNEAQATLGVIQGDELCELGSITLKGLKPETGSALRYADNLQSTIASFASTYGISEAELSAENASEMIGNVFDRDLIGLYQSAKGPEGSQSLTGLYQALSNDDKALLDALIAKSGALESLELLKKKIRTPTNLPINPIGKTGYNPPSPLDRFTHIPEKRLLLPQAPHKFNHSVLQDKLAPRTAAELSQMMNSQLSADAGTQNDVQIYRDLSGLAGTASGSLFSLYTRSEVPNQVANAYNEFLFTWTLIDKIKAGLYPSELTNPSIAGGPGVIVTNQSGAIVAFNVTPRAKGLKAEDLAFDLAFQRASYMKAIKKTNPLNNALEAHRKKALALASQLDTLKKSKASIKALADSAARATKAIELLDGVGNSSLDGILKMLTSTGYGKISGANSVPPLEYPPVNILEAGYYTASKTGGAISMGERSKRLPYTGVQEGESSITLLSNGAKFANSQVTAAFSVTVRKPNRIYGFLDPWIEAGAVCASPNTPVRLTFFNKSGKPQTGVAWRIAEGVGKITPDGVYTAPPRSGAKMVVIKATRSDETASIELPINCKCYWKLQAFAGGANVAAIGTEATALDLRNATRFTFGAEDMRAPMPTLMLEKPIFEGAYPLFKDNCSSGVNGNFFVSNTPSPVISMTSGYMDNCPGSNGRQVLQPPQVTIFNNDKDYIEGIIRGPIYSQRTGVKELDQGFAVFTFKAAKQNLSPLSMGKNACNDGF